MLRSMAITISISISMTTNLILDDFVTFFLRQHYYIWEDYCIGTVFLNANFGQCSFCTKTNFWPTVNLK